MSGSLEGGAGPGGAVGDAGDGAVEVSASGAAGAAGAAPNGAPPVEPPTCAEPRAWSSQVVVDGVSSAAEERFLSITPDELDLAFLREDALYVAHRSRPSDPFEVGPALPVPDGWSARHGASLSADGQRLVLVSEPDQKQLAELTRTSRTGRFSAEVDESAFANVNQDAVYTGKLYAAPVVSARDDQLFFNSSFPDAESTVVVSTRAEDGRWSAPRQLVSSLLDGAPGERRLPSGVSADARTLFYFNEESAEEEARWRRAPNVNAPLYELQILAAERGAAPNLACDRLYASADGDVVVGTH